MPSSLNADDVRQGELDELTSIRTSETATAMTAATNQGGYFMGSIAAARQTRRTGQLSRTGRDNCPRTCIPAPSLSQMCG